MFTPDGARIRIRETSNTYICTYWTRNLIYVVCTHFNVCDLRDVYDLLPGSVVYGIYVIPGMSTLTGMGSLRSAWWSAHVHQWVCIIYIHRLVCMACIISKLYMIYRICSIWQVCTWVGSWSEWSIRLSLPGGIYIICMRPFRRKDHIINQNNSSSKMSWWTILHALRH